MDLEALLAQSIENTAVLHTAGIPLLAGSDAPNPGTAHGLSVHVELEFLVQAGMRPNQALHAATRLPAEHFGLEDLGCIRTGCRTDLLLVNGDPGTDIRATRQIAAVWKNGLPVTLERSPAETAWPASRAVVGRGYTPDGQTRPIAPSVWTAKARPGQLHHTFERPTARPGQLRHSFRTRGQGLGVRDQGAWSMHELSATEATKKTQQSVNGPGPCPLAPDP